MKLRIVWVVKLAHRYWEGPFLRDTTPNARRTCEFTRLESARAVARNIRGRVFRRTRRRRK